MEGDGGRPPGRIIQELGYIAGIRKYRLFVRVAAPGPFPRGRHLCRPRVQFFSVQHRAEPCVVAYPVVFACVVVLCGVFPYVSLSSGPSCNFGIRYRTEPHAGAVGQEQISTCSAPRICQRSKRGGPKPAVLFTSGYGPGSCRRHHHCGFRRCGSRLRRSSIRAVWLR